MTSPHALYDMLITHARTEEAAAVRPHRLSARTYMFLLDIDHLSDTGPFISYNRFNVFSFYSADHFKFSGPQNNTRSMAERVKQHLTRAGLPQPDRILLLTNLRVLGYVFNPVSFYFCYTDRKLIGALAEVNNTFGEQHSILIDCRSGTDDRGAYRYRTRKNFYISPFLKHDTDLFFHFRDPMDNDKFFIQIDSGYMRTDRPEILVRATMTGNRRPFTTGALIYEFFRVPFVTLRIIAGIHWNALLLYLKKIPYYTKKEIDEDIARTETTGYQEARP